MPVQRETDPLALQSTVRDIRVRNVDADLDEIQRIVDEAVSEVRSDKTSKA